MAEFSIFASAFIEYTSATSGSPLTASDCSKPRMNPTTTKINSTTTASAPKVSALRDGRRSRLRTPNSHGNSRKRNMANPIQDLLCWYAMARDRGQSQDGYVHAKLTGARRYAQQQQCIDSAAVLVLCQRTSSAPMHVGNPPG